MKIPLGIACCVLATAIAGAADKKPFDRSETIQLKAAVESVDSATRTIVLKGEGGAREAIVAGPEVRNFAQIKAGDNVLLTYYVGVAAQVKPRGSPATAPVAGEAATERAAPGERPSASIGQSVAATVKIESVDTSFNTVTFKRADGITRTIAVEDPDARKFLRTLKPGDAVEIMYTEATAVSVVPTES